MLQISRVAVGHRSLEVVPDEFIGVEFGRVTREPVGMQTRVSSEELPDFRPLVVVAAIP